VVSERTRLERKGLLITKVHLLAVDGNELLQLGYSGSGRRGGWAVHSDHGSVGEASGALWLVVRDLERTGYRRVEWVDETAFDGFVAALREDAT